MELHVTGNNHLHSHPKKLGNYTIAISKTTLLLGQLLSTLQTTDSSLMIQTRIN